MEFPKKAIRLCLAVMIALAGWAQFHCVPVSQSPMAAASPSAAKTQPNPVSSESRQPLFKDEVSVDTLGVEAVRTLALIRSGGPYPYKKDGAVFANRERRLPQRQHGYYREYTVPTPGAGNRGARRIVSGGKNEVYYYSGDHYRTFRRLKS